MKKIYMLLIALLLVFIPNVYGEDLKFIEINLYEKEVQKDMSQDERDAMDFLLYQGYLLEGDYIESLNGASVSEYTDKNGNLLFYLERPPFDENSRFFINENSTINKLDFAFSSEDKELLSLSTLAPYDGISLLLFEPEVTNCTSVCIQKISLKDMSEGAIIKKRATFEGLSLDLDVQFSKVNDFVTYKVTIDNPTDKDYEISSGDNFSTSEYIKYEYKFEDNNSVLKAKENKVIEVSVRYNKEVPSEKMVEESFKEDNKAVIKLANGVEPTPTPTPVPEEKPAEVEVPDTYTGLSIFVVIAIIAIAGYISYNKLSNKSLLLLIIPILLIPVIVNAYEKLEIKVETHIEIVPPKNILAARPILMDSNNIVTDTNTFARVYSRGYFWDYVDSIKTITFENKIREIENYSKVYDLSIDHDERIIGYLVQNESNSSMYDLYIMANGIIYANPISTKYFAGMYNLETINNMNYLNTSFVNTMDYMFNKAGMNSTNFTLSLGDNFDTKNVINMSTMFGQVCENSTSCRINLGPIFDTTNVTNMSYMFENTGYMADSFELNLGDKFYTDGKDTTSIFCNTGLHSGYQVPDGFEHICR